MVALELGDCSGVSSRIYGTFWTEPSKSDRIR